MTCWHCKMEVPDTMEYCPYCGRKLTANGSDESLIESQREKRKTKLSSPPKKETGSDNNKTQRNQTGLNIKIEGRTASIGALAVLLLIAVILLIGTRTKNNGKNPSNTGSSLTSAASSENTSSSSAMTGSTSIAEVEEPTSEVSEADTAASIPASADTDSYEEKEDESAPVITCDVDDLVLQIGESREVRISVGGSDLPDRLAISMSVSSGIIDWEWGEWIDDRSVTATVTGIVDGDVQLELYFSDGNDESEEPTKLASTYLSVKVIPSESSASSDYPADALSYKGHHYYVYDDNTGNWDEAKSKCEARGGYLAVINNADENEALFRYMVDSGFDQAYFGMTDRDKEGEWKYTGGDSSTFTDWGENSAGTKEPNNSDGESYAMLDVNMYEGHWNDAEYGRQVYTPDGDKYKNKYAYICEWDY